MPLSMVTLRFTRRKGFTPWLIRTYTWSEVDHVEFLLPNQKMTLGAIPDGGVQLRPYKPQADEIIAYVHCSSEIARKVMDYAHSQIGKPYDWSAIYGIATHRNYQESDKWICSELIAAAFERAGLPLLNGKDSNRFSPRDIYISPYVRLP